MSRPTTTLLIFFVAFNLFAGMLGATGVGSMLGVSTDIGGDEQLEERVEQSENVSSGAPTGSTLFGMYNVLSGQIGGLVNYIFPGLTMMENAGVPSFITSFFFSAFWVVFAIDMMSFLRGWDL